MKQDDIFSKTLPKMFFWTRKNELWKNSSKSFTQRPQFFLVIFRENLKKVFTKGNFLHSKWCCGHQKCSFDVFSDTLMTKLPDFFFKLQIEGRTRRLRKKDSLWKVYPATSSTIYFTLRFFLKVQNFFAGFPNLSEKQK